MLCGRRSRRLFRLQGVASVFLAFFMGGGAAFATDCTRPRFEAKHDTRIGRGAGSLLLERPEESGFPLHDDATGRLLAGYLMQAADRGVRARLLLDDMDMAGRDAGLSAVSPHPNTETCLFNPFPSRSMRYLNFLSRFGTVTRRMHKTFSPAGMPMEASRARC